MALQFGIGITLMVRYGLLATSAYFLATFALAQAPLTLDPTLWYFWRGLLAVALVVGLGVFACWSATGGKRLFKEGFFGDD